MSRELERQGHRVQYLGPSGLLPRPPGLEVAQTDGRARGQTLSIVPGRLRRPPDRRLDRRPVYGAPHADVLLTNDYAIAGYSSAAHAGGALYRRRLSRAAIATSSTPGSRIFSLPTSSRVNTGDPPRARAGDAMVLPLGLGDPNSTRLPDPGRLPPRRAHRVRQQSLPGTVGRRSRVHADSPQSPSAATCACSSSATGTGGSRAVTSRSKRSPS